jgi:hypothetical protein
MAYLIAVTGRELGRGVLRALAGDAPTISQEELAGIADTEQNRITISAALGLPPSHASVTRWFGLQRTFAENSHLRRPPPSGQLLAQSYSELSELLFGLVAPYFDTHAELERFLRIASPSRADVEVAGRLLVRPIQRAHFFGQLVHPAWLIPLAEAGHFNSPPDRIVEPGGQWRAPAWPEGEYLVRIAALEPERVTALLLAIPTTLTNPAVWDVVTRAALALPLDNSLRLVGPLIQALRTAPPVILPTRLIELADRLAAERNPVVFDLADSLLWTTTGPRPLEMVEVGEFQRRIRGGLSTDWMMARLDAYELSTFISRVVPGLEAIDPVRTVRMLALKLNRVIQLTERRTAPVEEEAPTEFPWRSDDLDDLEDASDVRDQLAVALATTVRRAAGTEEATARSALEILGQYDHEVFTRIRMIALRVSGSFVPDLLDQVIMDTAFVLDPPLAGREVAELLRAQFEHSSPAAQEVFRYALERGPEPSLVAAHLETGASDPAAIEEVVAHWQRPRLRWFHDHIPAVLRPLAERLGVQPEVPSPQQQALDEVGFYTEAGARATAYVSPVSAEDIAAMDAPELIQYLQTWRPTGSRFENPSIEGLVDVLSRAVAQGPAAFKELASTVSGSGLPPGYLSALLRGFDRAAKEQSPLPWNAVATLLRGVMLEGKEAHERGLQGSDALEWRWTIDQAADLLGDAADQDLILGADSAVVWELVRLLVDSPIVWSGLEGGSSLTFGELVARANSSLPGTVTRALFAIALWDYRRLERETAEGQAHPRPNLEEDTVIAARLTPLVEEILSRDDELLAVRAMVGLSIPALHFLARRWFLNNAARLMSGGSERPMENPVWGSYILRGRFYDRVFADLRGWYVHAANSAPDSSPGSSSSSESTDARLAEHVLAAFLRGLCQAGDSDRLVETTFARVRVPDKNRSYWTVYRGWTDARESIPPSIVERLVAFWDWRLSELEAEPDSPERSEEAEGLEWLLITRQVPPAEAIQLGRRTLALSQSQRRASGTTWERLASLAEHDPVGTYDLVELLVKRALRSDHPYMPVAQIGPPLAAALRSTDPGVRDRARRLINSLGGRGYLEFGPLLTPELPE